MRKSTLKDFLLFRKDKNGRLWWVNHVDDDGLMEFTFDKRTIYCLFGDYPEKLSPKQKKICDKANPYWADFFKGDSN